jgi:RNA polymerase sigma-70 factor (ECF subfamily)
MYERIDIEKELLRRVSEGDEAAFKEIYQWYDRLLRPFLLELTKSEESTGDLVQETMMRIWLYRDRLHNLEHPRAYIYRIAGNRAFSWLRKQVNHAHLSETMPQHEPQEAAVAEASLSLQALSLALHKIIQSLPEQRRKIYLLSREQDIKPAEIARMLNISISTVNNTLYQSVKSIREELEKAGYILPLGLLLFFL